MAMVHKPFCVKRIKKSLGLDIILETGLFVFCDTTVKFQLFFLFAKCASKGATRLTLYAKNFNMACIDQLLEYD